MALVDGQLYSASKFFAQPIQEKRHGRHAAYDCTRPVNNSRSRREEECNCPETQPCRGDARFCRRMTCDDESSCYCTTRLVHLGTYLEITEDFGVVDPLLVSYKACIYQGPAMTINKRQLLSVDTADFSNDVAEIIFHDPVFSFNTSGTFIARKDGLEVVEIISDKNSQFVLPLAFRYSSGTLSFKFVTPQGKVLSGSVHIPSSTHCSRISCTFCYEMISNLSCMP